MLNKSPSITIGKGIATIYTPKGNYYCVPDMAVVYVRRLNLEWTAPIIKRGAYIIHHAIPEMGRIVSVDKKSIVISFGLSAYGEDVRYKMKLSDVTYPDFTSDILAWQGCNYEQI